MASRLQELRDELFAGGGHGQTVFVVGEDRDGRMGSLHQFAARCAENGDRLIAGRLERHGLLPWTTLTERDQNALNVLAANVPLAPTIQSALQLFSPAFQEGTEPWTLLSSLQGPAAEADPAVILPEILRVQAEAAPLIIVVDCAEDAQPGWWGDLLTLFAQDIARGVSVLLVVGLEREPSPEPQTSGALATAARLTRQGVAQTWELDARPDDELPTLERLNERLGKLLPDSEGLQGVRRSRELLAVAAQEGQRFAAEALAIAMGLDRDAVIDHLDDVLVHSEDEQPDGLIAEGELLTINDSQGERHLWLYRFIDEADYLALRHLALDAEVLPAHRRRLAEALAGVYGDAVPVVAATTARLYGSDADGVAAGLWRLSRLGTDGDTALWRAGRLLQLPPPETDTDRVTASEVYLQAASALYSTGRAAEGLTVSQAALSTTEPDSPEHGTASYLSGWYRLQLDQRAEARTELETAVRIAREHAIAPALADALHQLAGLDMAEEQLDSARERFTEVGQLRQQLEDGVGIIAVTEMLGELERISGNLPLASQLLHQVLTMAEQLQDAGRVLGAQVRLGRFHRTLPEPELNESDAHYSAALSLCETNPELGPFAPGVLAEFAELDLQRGNLERARDRCTMVLSISADNPGVATGAHLVLAQIHLQEGNRDAAQAACNEAVRRVGELGNAQESERVRQITEQIMAGPDAGDDSDA